MAEELQAENPHRGRKIFKQIKEKVHLRAQGKKWQLRQYWDKTDKLKLVSVNVAGLDSPTKCIKIFNQLKKQNSDILCLQETHIKKKFCILNNTKLSEVYLAFRPKQDVE